MPFQPTLPTWLAVNAANFTSPSSFTDLRTQQPIFAGGLNLGDYFDLTEKEANNLSDTLIGLLHWGRYRLVQLDANATQSDVAAGTAAFFAKGKSVQNVVIATAGTGQTPGTYQAASSGGGGTGAVIQYTIGAGGTLTAASVLTPGINYTTTATFTIAAGGTPGTVAAQMLLTPNIVTGFTNPLSLSALRGVFLNAITPGNYGFIQELGEATVLGAAALTAAAVGAIVGPKAASAGAFDATVATAAQLVTQIGYAVDLPVAATTFRAVLDLPALQD